MHSVRWWRPAVLVGATTVMLTVAGCGTQPSPTTASSAAGTPTATSAGPCKPLPPSEVPGLDRALTQAETGAYCGRVGLSVLVVLKASSAAPTDRWTDPAVTGPAQGAQSMAVPLTALRGTTVAALRLTKAGTYRLTSTSGHTAWSVDLRVS